MVNQQN